MGHEQLFIGSIYIAGLLSFFSPCIFPVIPVYLSILSQGGERSLLRTIAFLIGLSVTFLALGFGAGLLGKLVYNDTLRIVGGIIVILMGLFQADILRVRILERMVLFRKTKESEGLGGPFFLGLTFSLGWTPCVGPVLASILLISSSSHDVGKSLFTMFVYMLGLATPFILFSLASAPLLEKANRLKRHLGTLKKVGGYLIIIMGILLIFNQLNVLL